METQSFVRKTKKVFSVLKRPQYLKERLGFGVLMFNFCAFLLPLIQGNKITLQSILIWFIVTAIIGFCYGITMSLLKKKVED